MTTALLIIDIQRALCRGGEGAFDIDRVIERINQLSTRARAAGLPVVLIQHEEEGGPLQQGSEGWQLDESLLVAPDDLPLRKQTLDSFHETGLHPLLQRSGVDHLIVCGLQSDFCVDSTVRRALALGYDVTLAADAHSTVANGALSAAQISAHHNTILRNMGSFGPSIRVVPTVEVTP